MYPLNISFQTYVKTLLIIIGIIFIPALLVDIQQEPLNGDLTRIGKFSENDFGWNGQSFKLAKEPKFKGNINEQYDVIILGDSFSHNSSSWSKIFFQLTNLRIGQFNTNKYDIFKLVNTLKNNNNLPSIFIYESVERNLKNRLNKFSECPSQGIQLSINTLAVEYNLNKIHTIPYYRDKTIKVDDLAFNLKYIMSNLLEKHGKVKQFNLINASLFSNVSSDKILVYSNDLLTVSWTKQDWNKITCNALHIQNILGETGITNFVFLVAPDKTTIYKKFITKKNISGSQLDILSSNTTLNFLRADDFLAQQVEQGEKDIYWPNDTHWSYRGHELIAEKMIKYLTEKKFIKKVN